MKECDILGGGDVKTYSDLLHSSNCRSLQLIEVCTLPEEEEDIFSGVKTPQPPGSTSLCGRIKRSLDTRYAV